MAVTVIFTTRPCMVCDQTTDIHMTEAEAAALAAHTPVQDVMPHVEPAQRELLVSGTHPECWTAMFDA